MANREWTAIIRAVGVEAAEILLRHFGGTRLYVPTRPKGDHPLVKLLGAERAEILGRTVGGILVCIPRRDPAHAELRDGQIRKARAAGLPIRDIALQYELTERQVYRILSPADDGPSLFEARP